MTNDDIIELATKIENSNDVFPGAMRKVTDVASWIIGETKGVSYTWRDVQDSFMPTNYPLEDRKDEQLNALQAVNFWRDPAAHQDFDMVNVDGATLARALRGVAYIRATANERLSYNGKGTLEEVRDAVNQQLAHR